jgi:hypothetical protein
MTECIHLSMSIDDFRFITTYDPDRERSASRRDLATVIEEIQTILLDGGPRHCPNCNPAAEEAS